MALKFNKPNKHPLFNEYLTGICAQNIAELLTKEKRAGYEVIESIKHGSHKPIPEPVLTVRSKEGAYELEVSIDYNTVTTAPHWWFYLRNRKTRIAEQFGVVPMEWQFRTTMKNLLTKLEKADFEAV